jgi:hypothetical protein
MKIDVLNRIAAPFQTKRELHLQRFACDLREPEIPYEPEK